MNNENPFKLLSDLWDKFDATEQMIAFQLVTGWCDAETPKNPDWEYALERAKKQLPELIKGSASLVYIFQQVNARKLTYLDAMLLAIVQAESERKFLQEELIRARAINPQRVVLPDGRIARWDAPDHLVPIVPPEVPG